MPDGVLHHQRKAFSDKFVLGSSASDAERKELLIKGFVGLNEQVVAPKVCHLPTHDKMKLAVPKAAAVLADIALSSKLQWAGSADAAEIFPETLHCGLPLCVREHVDAARRMQPPEPETSKKKASKRGSERGAEGSGDAANRGLDASGSSANAPTPGGGNWRRSDSATKLLRAWWNYNATGEKQTLPWRDQPAFFETLQQLGVGREPSSPSWNCADLLARGGRHHAR